MILYILMWTFTSDNKFITQLNLIAKASDMEKTLIPLLNMSV